MASAGDIIFKGLTGALVATTLYLTATFSVNLYRGISWHNAQSNDDYCHGRRRRVVNGGERPWNPSCPHGVLRRARSPQSAAPPRQAHRRQGSPRHPLFHPRHPPPHGQFQFRRGRLRPWDTQACGPRLHPLRVFLRRASRRRRPPQGPRRAHDRGGHDRPAGRRRHHSPSRRSWSPSLVPHQQPVRAVGARRGGGDGDTRWGALGPIRRRLHHLLLLPPRAGEVPHRGEPRRGGGVPPRAPADEAGGAAHFPAADVGVQAAAEGNLGAVWEHRQSDVGVREHVPRAGARGHRGDFRPYTDHPGWAAGGAARGEIFAGRYPRRPIQGGGLHGVARRAGTALGGVRLRRQRRRAEQRRDGGDGVGALRLPPPLSLGGARRHAQPPPGRLLGRRRRSWPGDRVELAGARAGTSGGVMLRDALRVELDAGGLDRRRADDNLPSVRGPSSRLQVPGGGVRRRGAARSTGDKGGDEAVRRGGVDAARGGDQEEGGGVEEGGDGSSGGGRIVGPPHPGLCRRDHQQEITIDVV